MKPVEFHWLKVGYCTHPECMVMRGGSLRSKEFPSTVGVFKSGEEVHLFDTGYDQEFFHATEKLPYRLYRMVTPVFFNEEDCLLKQLESLDIRLNQVKNVIISHFHGDHIAGLKNFPNSQFLYLKSAYGEVKNKTGISALLKGFLPKLIPTDFENRSILLESLDEDFIPEINRDAYDVLRDQSLWAVRLPGHAKDQIGLFFLDQKSQKKVFLVADASWSIQAISESRLPNKIAYILFDSHKEYDETQQYLHKLYHQGELTILPNHCSESFRLWHED